MSKALIQVRVDAAFKRDIDLLFADMGLDTQTAIRMFLKQTMDMNALPFPVKRRINTETLAAMDDARQGRNLVGPFHSAEDMMASILEDAEDEDGEV